MIDKVGCKALWRTALILNLLFPLLVSSIYAETAEEYFSRGVAYHEQGNLTQAISDFTNAIEINPKLAEAYPHRGDAYLMIKDYGKAWTDVHKAEELGYKFPSDFLEKLRKASGREK